MTRRPFIAFLVMTIGISSLSFGSVINRISKPMVSDFDFAEFVASLKIDDDESLFFVKQAYLSYSTDCIGLRRAWRTFNDIERLAGHWFSADPELQRLAFGEGSERRQREFLSVAENLDKKFFAEVTKIAPEEAASLLRKCRRAFYLNTEEIGGEQVEGAGIDLTQAAQKCEALFLNHVLREALEQYERDLDMLLREYETVMVAYHFESSRLFTAMQSARDAGDEASAAKAAEDWAKIFSSRPAVLLKLRQLHGQFFEMVATLPNDENHVKEWQVEVAPKLYPFVWNCDLPARIAASALRLTTLDEAQRVAISHFASEFAAERELHRRRMNILYEQSISPSVWKARYLSQARAMVRLPVVADRDQSENEAYRVACEKWKHRAAQFERSIVDVLNVEQQKVLGAVR